MILYHGSYMAVEKPDILHSREYLDFGKGFYTTPIYEQAKNRLKYEKSNLQMCFPSQELINKYLIYQDCEVF